MYFELKVICELLIFYPCAVKCDYLNRYYSLCDIGILALSLWWLLAPALCRRWVPALCRQFRSGFVSAMSSGFVSVIIMWPWVRFSGLERCYYCSQYSNSIVSSFMLRYFEEYIVCNLIRTFWEALCYVNLFILVILFWGNDFVETIWKFPN